MIERKKEVAEKVIGAGEGWLTALSNEDLREVLALSKEAVAPQSIGWHIVTMNRDSPDQIGHNFPGNSSFWDTVKYSGKQSRIPSSGPGKASNAA